MPSTRDPSTTDEIKAQAAATSAVGRAIAWWQETRDRWRRLHELQGLPPGDLERLSHEVGMTSAEFTNMAAMPLGVPKLLTQRLETLQLSAAEIERLSPLLLADLSNTCAKCGDKRRCAKDLAANDVAGAEGSADWRHYCANAGTLDLLGAELHTAQHQPKR